MDVDGSTGTKEGWDGFYDKFVNLDRPSWESAIAKAIQFPRYTKIGAHSARPAALIIYLQFLGELTLEEAEEAVKILHPEDHKSMEEKWGAAFDRSLDRRRQDDKNDGYTTLSAFVQAIEEASRDVSYTEIENRNHAARASFLQKRVRQLTLEEAEEAVKILHPEDHKSMEEKWGAAFDRSLDRRRQDDKNDGYTTLSAFVQAIEEASRDVSYTEIENRNHAARASFLQKRVRQLTLEEAEEAVKILHPEDHKSMEEKWGAAFDRSLDSRRQDDKNDGYTTLSAFVQAIEEASRDVSYTEIENRNHAARASFLQKRVRQLTLEEAEEAVKILHPEDHKSMEEKWGAPFDRSLDRRRQDDKNDGYTTLSAFVQAIEEASRDVSYTEIENRNHAARASFLQKRARQLTLEEAEEVVKILHPEDHKSMEEKWGAAFDRSLDRRRQDDKNDGYTTLSAFVQAIGEASRDVSYTEIENRNHAARASFLQKRVRQLTLEEAEEAVKILHPEDHKSMEEKWGAAFDSSLDRRRQDDKNDGYTTLSAFVQAIEEASRDVSYTEIENRNHAARASVLQKRVRQLTLEEAEEAVKILHPGELSLSDDSVRGRGMHIVDGLDIVLSHRYDLDRFSLRIDELFEWHKDKAKQAEYMAPYFAVVQSSGMGKTKLFTEYRKTIRSNNSNNTAVLTILCIDAGLTEDVERKYYDHDLVLAQMVQQRKDASDIVAMVGKFLDDITGEKKGEKTVNITDSTGCVLLFDEAQGLMRGTENQHGNLMFRAIRWWLRVKRTRPVVAVFAGTTTKLSNFFPPDPPMVGVSRNPLVRYKNFDGRTNRDPATALYPPFFKLHTISCLSDHSTGHDDGLDPNFPNAALYGRPLFAHYYINRQLEKKAIIESIAQRLVLSADDYSTSLEACYSVLGSRVQMGMVNSFDTLSHLVSSGYACLVEFREGDSVRRPVAGGTFMPDPVCATLAMRFMDKDCFLYEKTWGKGKAFWVQQAERAFSSKLCQPDKGNVGEVFAALYILFCGDVLRKNDDPTLSKFSVSLDEWFMVLRNGGKLPGGEANNDTIVSGDKEPATQRVTRSTMSRNDDENRCSLSGENKDNVVVTCTVSFVQICRNDLRSNSFCRSSRLEWLYKSGVGCYTYKNCKAFDIAASIKVVTGDSVKYHPLLISVKNWSKPTLRDFRAWKQSNLSFLNEIQKNRDLRAVCIILLVGYTDLHEAVIDETSSRSLKPFPIEDVFRLVPVPNKDAFGISTAISNISNILEPAEIFGSHAFLVTEEASSSLLLRKKSSETDIDVLSKALCRSGL